MSDRLYYPEFTGVDLLRHLSRKARSDMFEIFMRETRPGNTTTILDVGVSVIDDNPSEANMLEQRYPYPANITMLGIHDGAFLEQQFPGTRYVRYDPQSTFPFGDGQFDICYCNAVIEHIGVEADRKRFLREMVRVGRKVFLTTPNRWYPVEFHKMLPLVHWLPQDWYRAIIGLMGDTFYSQKENLDLLSLRSLEQLLRGTGVPFRVLPYRFLGLVSNFIAVTE
jgi:hypothetical protein